MDNQRIVQDIVAHMVSNGSNFPKWYIGIATDPKVRLFNDHLVMEKGDVWIYRCASCSDDARLIENHLIKTYKTKGDIGGGDNSTKYIYAYLTTSLTKD